MLQKSSRELWSKGRCLARRALQRITRDPDIVLLHAPSVYDFRERPEIFGPISDVIPSSPVFEMYPIGLTSIADYLEDAGYDVQIINLAYRMLEDSRYDPEKEIERLDADYFGIDLHWLPHAHGSIEVAKIVKEKHPDAELFMGGLSSSYFHDELVEYDAVDYVLRGDSTEKAVRELIDTREAGKPPEDVGNLTWQEDGETQVNPIKYSPPGLDDVTVPAYRYVAHSVPKYGSLKNVVPHSNWIDDPMTMLLLSRGCNYNCKFCGGSSSGYQITSDRKNPAFRSPEKIVEDVKTIERFSQGPIFVVQDPRTGGEEYMDELFHRLEEAELENEFIFELFDPAGEEFFERLESAVPEYSLELSPESHRREIRERTGKFTASNEEIEKTIEHALEHGCNRIDLFFLIGLPGQSYEDAVGSANYVGKLLEKFDDRIMPFIAPLAPFLDPGSPGFENPEENGYRLLRKTLEEHREVLLEPSWKQMLNYETEEMSRDDIARATYDAAEKMNRLKYEHGIIDEEAFQEVENDLENSRQMVKKADRIKDMSHRESSEELKKLYQESGSFGEKSICGENELSWTHNGFQPLHSLAFFTGRIYWDGLKKKLFG